ncbi:hypothetical protein BC830DRAFT_475181 [Chytriomyces sp. MP71]|nr:hypothetical protein BC830DRAFT_475181 [Chytriomyces sp. MP71]
MRADLLVARKQGHNRLFPSSMINSIMTDYMFPNEDVFFLIRTAIRSTNRPLVALRWNLNGLTQESALPCAASLLRHLKRSLKMQNWNAAFLETLNAAPPPSLQDEPRLSAHVYLSTSLFPRYDAADVFTKPSKATGAASMDPPPRHLLNVYWYLRKRIHGLLDVSMLFDERDVFGEGAYHALFWELVEGVIFEEADIVLFGTGECSAASAPANQLDEWVFVERVKARRKARAFALLPDVSSDEDGPDGGPRDEDGVRIVYQTMYWK